jgi:DNA modification methylase
MKLEKAQLETLKLDQKNARGHDERNIDAIARSLESFGQQKPIVVTKGGKVVAGNGTVVAARRLGWDSLEVVRTDLRGPHRKAYAIADNKSAELAEWQEDRLAETLLELENDDRIDELLTGFSEEEIDRLISEIRESEDTSEIIDSSPPPPLPDGVTVLEGDTIEQLKTLPDKSVHCVVTSPPYWGLRDYGVDGQIGLEESIEEWIAKLVEVFRGVRRVLRDDGTLWLNLGDCYASNPATGGEKSAKLQGPQNATPDRPWNRPRGLKPKDLVGQPWRVAFALQADGWYLRSAIIWHKPNPMPESVTDRPTSSHEYMFLLTKSERYFYDADAVREPHVKGDANSGSKNYRVDGGEHREESGQGREDNPLGRNLRDVWTIATQAYPDAHFATFPTKLVEPCIKAGTSERGCCPNCGAAWVRKVEMTKAYKDLLDRDGAWTSEAGKPNKETKRQEKGHPSTVPEKHRTIGWQPTCTCGFTETVPCIVLDPFGGSGTTAEVALANHCNAILIELNPEYVTLAKRRLDKSVRKS